jgi:hypothetical protein
MTQRLPIPGADSGDWGDILNSFLEVSLASDGTLNSNTVGTNQLASNSVTNAQLDTPTQTILASVANKYTLPSGGIPYTDLAGNIPASSLSNSVQSSLTNAANAYVKPNTGIPATDLSTAVQTNLSSAATALQPGVAVGGDLSGSLPSPTVAKLQGTSISSPTGGATSYLNATGTWTTPSGGGGGGSSTLAGDSDVSISSPATGQLLTYDSTTSKWVNVSSSENGSIIATMTQDYLSGGLPASGTVQSSPVNCTNTDYLYIFRGQFIGNNPAAMVVQTSPDTVTWTTLTTVNSSQVGSSYVATYETMTSQNYYRVILNDGGSGQSAGARLIDGVESITLS